MMHMFHEGCSRLGELVHRFAVCRHGWRRLRTHVILLFPHCFTPCAPGRETLLAPYPRLVKHSENIPAGGISSILTALKHFNGDGGRCVRGASRTSQRRGSHCPMATALLNSDVNGGTVARVSARVRSWRQR